LVYPAFAGILTHSADLNYDSLGIAGGMQKLLALCSATLTLPAAAQTDLHTVASEAAKPGCLEEHSVGQQRRIEILSAPVRDALSCRKDFEMKDCVI